MNTKVNKFEDLLVWQEAHKLSLEIYTITKEFPRDELFGITSQMRRAASSVAANIVEGYYRDTTKELVKFLYNARGSAGEVTYFLILVRDLKYISTNQYTGIRQNYERLLRMINGLIRSLIKK